MVIDHFMWGYQPHFRIKQEVAARYLFRPLDARIDPEVFLIGVRADQAKGNFPACVEPESDFWLPCTDVYGIGTAVEAHLAGFPESQLMQSHPIAQKHSDEALLRRAIRLAVQNLVNAHASKPAGMNYRSSLPTLVGDYWVSAVLGLPSAVVNPIYALNNAVGWLHQYRSFTLTTSLLDALITIFFDRISEQLAKPDAGMGWDHTDDDDMLRKAGRRFMSDLGWRIDQDRMVGRETLFHACNTISSLFYEKSIGRGSVILARENHPNVHQHISFETPAELRDFRGARKFLEMTLSDLSLYSNTEKIFGLAAIENYAGTEEDLFEVRVLGHHHWELLHTGKSLMKVKYGQPYWSKPEFDRAKLRADLPRLFAGIGPIAVEKMVGLVEQAERESHGTTLIITSAAETEAKRLQSQATVVVPCDLSPEMLRHLTPIDGALIMSPEGRCHAIGAILDGDATANGNAARGARFNSAVRYIDSREEACLAVVVSSDGGVDLIPELRPAIARAAVDEKLQSLTELSCETEPSQRKFRAAHDWLEAHRFYLLAADCAAANDLVSRIDTAMTVADPSGVRFVRRLFEPDPTMDPAKYYFF